MRNFQWGLIIGISIGVAIGVVLAMSIMRCIRYRTKRSDPFDNHNEEKVSPRAETIPIRVHGADSSTICQILTSVKIPLEHLNGVTCPNGWKGLRERVWRPHVAYRSTLISEGAFGPVYKAQMATGQTVPVAVKILATDSRQGAMEFLTEVLLLGRLHHRNLVNLVGYSAERGQHMLVYVYMSNGNLASHLYTLDVARGLEYLHYGAIPPVVHRDIKSSDILLDRFMKARVDDFGLSRLEKNNLHSSKVKGTFGYVDPEYMSTLIFTKKSDVYSFGVLLFEIMSGKNPQQGLVEKRPSMREIVLALSEIRKPRNSRVHHGQNYHAKAEETTFELDLQGTVDPLTER
ncbi:hypothetical protein CRYUN_Cryun37aG0118800 [Craigia yunnanensis]